jgi:hypothetical protein
MNLGNRTIQGIVDTGAEVTVISDQLYDKLPVRPRKGETVILHNACRETKMTGFLTEPTDIIMGGITFTLPLYVAPISDDCLIGMDLLSMYDTSIQPHKRKLLVRDVEIDLQPKLGTRPPLCRVTLPNTITLGPRTITQALGVLEFPISDFVVEPRADLARAWMPYTLQPAGNRAMLCFVNDTDQEVVLNPGQILGTAKEVNVSDGLTPDPAEVDLSINRIKPDSSKDDPWQIPDHLQDLFNRSSKHLSEIEQKQLAQLLRDFSDVFAKHYLDLGEFTAFEHGIDTGNAAPIKQRMRRTPLGFENEEEAHLKKMLEAGVIQPSHSEWASPPVLIRKSDSSVRWCIDFRGLNAASRKDVFPLPPMDACIDTLAGSAWYSKLDANSAYWQIKIKEQDRHKTAFITKYGLFEHIRMGFGLCNAPATYSRVTALVLNGLTWDIVLAFLDDAVVTGKNIPNHMVNLETVLSRFRKYNLKLKPRKCEMFQKEIEFLGRLVSPNALRVNPKSIETVVEWPVPKNTRDVQRFLGFANYHRAFIKAYAEMATPLYNITGKEPFHWDEEQQLSFQNLKEALTSTPVLSLPNKEDLFILDTDASGFAIGA